MKNKTRKSFKILCAILVVAIIQSIGFTYAKYVTQDKGTGSAEIAKWAFQMNTAGTQTKTVNLVSTVDKDTLVDGKIAPGTSGSIVITIDATGTEVNMDYSLGFTNEKNKPSNLIFTCYGTDYNSLSEITNLHGTIKHDEENQKRELAILWSWPYETGETTTEINANDVIDSQEANSITQYTFDIVATATQSE